MPLTGLNHVNIEALPEQISAVRDFYIQVLGLSEGWHPDIGRRVHWLYIGDNPVVHLVENTTGRSAKSRLSDTALDHVSFTAEDLEGMQQTLRAAGIEFSRIDSPENNACLLFFNDPLGIKLELNFTLGDNA